MSTPPRIPGRTAGLILAAGAGSRYGLAPKLLAEFGGRPLLEHTIEAMCAVTELERVIIVLGAHAAELNAAITFGRAEAIPCPTWHEGMSASLRTGAAALPEAERVIVTLGDTPTISPELIRRFLDAPSGARAAFDGRPGHPVVLGPEQLARISELNGDEGARRLIQGGPLIECGDLSAGADVDTVTDLERLRSSTAT